MAKRTPGLPARHQRTTRRRRCRGRGEGAWRGDRGETGTVFGLLSGETANFRDAARQGLVVRV